MLDVHFQKCSNKYFEADFSLFPVKRKHCGEKPGVRSFGAGTVGTNTERFCCAAALIGCCLQKDIVINNESPYRACGRALSDHWPGCIRDAKYNGHSCMHDFRRAAARMALAKSCMTTRRRYENLEADQDMVISDLTLQP